MPARGRLLLTVGGGLLLGLGFSPAEAQQWSKPVLEPQITLTLTVEEGMLIAQALNAVRGCDTVAGMLTCEKARAILNKITDQVGTQGK